MTRYVEHKHGIVIGSGNVFFFRGLNNALSDGWSSIVWAKGYTFDEYSTLHAAIKTPAETLLWTHNVDGGVALSRYIVSYLTNTIGARGVEWDVRPFAQDTNDAIFFRTRKNAIVLVKFLKTQLAGMKYL